MVITPLLPYSFMSMNGINLKQEDQFECHPWPKDEVRVPDLTGNYLEGRHLSDISDYSIQHEHRAGHMLDIQ